MIEVRRLAPRIGAEVTGVDVRKLADAEFDAIYRAWLDSTVLVVRDQALEMGEYLAYSRRFGLIEPHPSKPTRHPQYPEVTLLGANKIRADGTIDMEIYRRGSHGWHTDGSYNERPFKATQMYAVALPSRGGDTLFASMYAGYEALPAALKRRLEGLTAAYVYGGRAKNTQLLAEEDRDWKPVFHPIIGTHPETKRKVFYFDPNKVIRIEGLPEDESDALIDELTQRIIQPDAQYRHKWRNGDIVIWDNRCSYHLAAGDYPPEEERIHWRVSISEHAARQ